MSHPKEAWKFRLWSEAMLRGATVGDPEYKGKTARVKRTGSKASRTKRISASRKRRKKRIKDA